MDVPVSGIVGGDRERVICGKGEGLEGLGQCRNIYFLCICI